MSFVNSINCEYANNKFNPILFGVFCIPILLGVFCILILFGGCRNAPLHNFYQGTYYVMKLCKDIKCNNYFSKTLRLLWG